MSTAGHRGHRSAGTAPRQAHPIEVESYRILRSRVATSHLPPWTRAVVERVVHASADPDFVGDLVCDECTLAAAVSRVRDSATPLVVDARMVAAGVTERASHCYVDAPGARDRARAEGVTRSAAAVDVALDEVGPDAVWVVGNAPTFLDALLARSAQARPALVVGLPVGFVGAVESKRALRASGLPAVTNRSEKGGSAVAAATVNALLYGSPL